MAAAAPAPLMITRWARRDHRLPEALERGYAALDGRSFAEQIAEIAHFARFVRYYNPDHVEDGSWEPLLAGDPTILGALVATLEVEEPARSIRRKLRRLRGEEEPEVREQALRGAIDELVGLAWRADSWVRAAEGSEGRGAGLAASALLLDDLLDRLAPPFRRFVAIAHAIRRARYFEPTILLVVDRFHGRWRIGLVDELEIGWDPDSVWLDSVGEPLTAAAEEFLDALEPLVVRARAELETSLERKDHPPQIGLLLAFVKLFGHERDRLNEILPRLATFYYDRVVGAPHHPPRPDRTWLAFRRRPLPGPPPRIDEGQGFEAGLDGSGKAVRFAADEALTVTGARLIRFDLWQVEAEAGRRRRVGLISGAPGAEGSIAEAFVAADSGLTPVEIGFVLEGPALRVESGTRQFAITVDLAGLAWPDSVPADEFAAWLASAFRLSLRSAEGWVPLNSVETGGAGIDGSSATFSFRFSLAADAPALGADVPALRFLLDQDCGEGELAPLAVLGDARVERVRVDLAVDGLGDLILSTISGPADSAIGLSPFGSPPAMGGWLQIDHPAFERPVDELELAISWADLPPYQRGFADYYRQYAVDLERRLRAYDDPLLDNESFRIRISAPVAGLRDGAEIGLFPQAERFGPVPATSSVHCEADSDGGAAAEAVRITLTAPPEGFGDLLFPINVAYATTVGLGAAERATVRRRKSRILAFLRAVDEAPIKLIKAIGQKIRDAWNWFFLSPEAFEPEEEEALELPAPAEPIDGALAELMPNPPWRPVLAGLKLDYRTHFEIGPLGGEALRFLLWTVRGREAAPARHSFDRLLPDLPDDTCIDFELFSPNPGEPLSLLFLLDPAAPDAPVRWQVDSAAGEWVEPKAIDDDTNALTRSGLVRFARAPTRLRAVATGRLPRILAILPDSLLATRILTGADDPVAPIAAGTIGDSGGLRGIESVRQPRPSFGGSAGEDVDEVAARTGERLRHRGRAIQSWDGERLILERFPEIDRIRILPARAADGSRKAGHVLAVVVPGAGGADAPDPLRPAAPPALLEAVEAELASRSSPSASIAAVAAAYVPVDIAIEAAIAAGTSAERLRADIAQFVSVRSDGPDLPDNASYDELGDAVVRFVRALPYVEAVADATATAPAAAAARPWLVPVAGEIVVKILRRQSFGR